ncbi:unnamed protein product [Mytilus coruscus]|uniref:Uncharacterized protein n=1 Tax=Mytilus coruscus TaxID=42192 RepID=A0A6J7ZYM4_MYTCO|nr:unnamed protein product [Mytilus coruscus]
MVPTSKKSRLVEHEKNFHRHVLNPKSGARELIIPSFTPQRSERKQTLNSTRRDQPLKQQASFTCSRPSTPPMTPNLTRSIIIFEISPCSISLGLEEYGSLTSITKNVESLFDSPIRQEETIAKEPETPTLRDNRFQAPPSRIQSSYEASKCMIVPEKARKTGKYSGSVLPSGYGSVRKDETCILPDGTVYKLTATWIQDPSFCSLKEKETQTEMLQQQIATQTEEDRRVVLITSETQTRRVILVEEEVQTDNLEKINNVVMVTDTDTEKELNLDIEEETRPLNLDECLICQQQFPDQKTLKRHLASKGTHGGRLSVVCLWCFSYEKRFSWISDLRCHLEEKHPEVGPKLEKNFMSEANVYWFSDFPEDYRRLVSKVTPKGSSAAVQARSNVTSWLGKCKSIRKMRQSWVEDWANHPRDSDVVGTPR